MDEFTPTLLKRGILAMIGKGRRSQEVRQAIKKYQAVYFLTYSGCGALLSKYIQKTKPVAYKELGPEAIYRMEVKNFPLIVGIDIKGRSVYD
jgi:fumarate hydratase subunit beta